MFGLNRGKQRDLSPEEAEMNRTGAAVQNGVDWVKQWVMTHFIHKNRVAYSSRGVPDRFRLVGLDGDGLIDASFGTGVFAKIQGGNTLYGRQVVSATGHDNTDAAFSADSGDFGNGDWGQWIAIGRNTNATNSGAGFLRLTERDGGYQDLWADATGRLRHRQGAPNTLNDLAGAKIAVDNADNLFTAAQSINGVSVGGASATGINTGDDGKWLELCPVFQVINTNAVYEFPIKIFGVLTVLSSTDAYSWMGMIRGGGNSLVAISDTSAGAVFTTTKDTASRINIYYDAGTGRYTIQNKGRGATSIWLHLVGT